MEFDVGFVIGALAITFLLIRLANWCLRKVGVNRFGLAHVLVAVVMTIVGAYGAADGGEPRFLFSAANYVSTAMVWLFVDYFRSRRKKA